MVRDPRHRALASCAPNALENVTTLARASRGSASRDAAVDPPEVLRDLATSGGSRRGPARALGGGAWAHLVGSARKPSSLVLLDATRLPQSRVLLGSGRRARRAVAWVHRPAQWPIRPRGRSAATTAKSATRNPPLATCDGLRARDLRFPPDLQRASATCARDVRARLARAIRPRPALASAWGRLGTPGGRRKRRGPHRSALGEFRGDDPMCFYSSQIVPI